jgi:4-hydroxy-3-polyprenylbenzoate decarboxylase
MVIVVDDDVDITNPREVIWAMSTRWDPRTQSDIIDDCWTGNVDPMLPPDKRDAHDFSNSRIIIYACKPYRWKDDFPVVNTISPALKAQMLEKWAGRLDFLTEPGS